MKLIFLILSVGGLLSASEELRLNSNYHSANEAVMLSELLGSYKIPADQDTTIANLATDESIEIPGREFAKILRTQLGTLASQIYIPDSVKIQRVTVDVYLKKSIEGQLKSYLDVDDVEVINFVPPKHLEHGRLVKITQRPNLGNFTAEVFADAKSERLGFVNGQYRSFARVPVAKRTLNLGESAGIDDYEFEIREITNETDAFPSRVKIATMEFRKARLAGQPIRLSDLKPPRLVKRGETVRAFLKGNNWKIQFRGLAQSDGTQGDQIQVVNMNNKRQLSARVVDKSTVEVE